MVDKYFAQKESKDLVNHLSQFNGQWDNITSPYQNGIGSVWARNINYYYNNILAGDSNSSLDFDGQLGELVKMVVPQARSLNQQYLSLITKQKLHFEPEAMSNDAGTLADTRVAAALCKDIVRTQNLDSKANKAAELATLVGSSFIKTCWDKYGGRQLGINPEDGSVAYSGGLKMSVHSVYDISFDYTKEDFYEQDWVQVKTKRNRWDLVANYPELEQEILKLPRANNESDTVFYWQMNMDEDSVWVYEFFHRSTPALPLGRYCVYASSTAVFYDEDNPYKNDLGAYIPIAEMKPECVQGTGFGYPNFSNLLPLQEMLDQNFSALSTNNNAFAVKSILNPMGNDINVKHIQGLKFINYKPMNVAGNGRPEILDLNSSNPELYKFSETIVSYMQQIYSINSAIRGEPGAGITSGTAIATLSANAIEFAQSFSKAYVGCLEKAVHHAILAYRNFATEPEVVAIAGPNDSSIAKQFIGDDLAAIRRVSCGISNPLMATSAGRLEIANNLLQTGQFSIKRYLKVLEGAPVDALYDREFDEENFIQQENDALREEFSDYEVTASATDDHPLHMQAHKSLLDNIDLRSNAALVQKVMDHIYEHFTLAKETDPLLYQMLKTGQMPDPQAMQQAQIAEQQPPPGIPMMGQGVPMAAAPADPALSVDPLQNQDMGGLAPEVGGQ
jgi:hypothetical protein